MFKATLMSAAVIALSVTGSVSVTETSLAKGTSADAIVGLYRNPDRSRTVRIYKKRNRYFGVIASAPSKPDGSEGVGFVVFKNFKYDASRKQWREGMLHSPMYGRQIFPGTLRLNNQGDLVVRGFVGIPLLGANSTFPKVR